MMRCPLLLAFVLCGACDQSPQSTPGSKDAAKITTTVNGLEIGGPWKPAADWKCRESSAGTACELPYDKFAGREVGMMAMSEDKTTLGSVVTIDKAPGPKGLAAWKHWSAKLSEKYGVPVIEPESLTGPQNSAKWKNGNDEVALVRMIDEKTSEASVMVMYTSDAAD